MRMIYEPQQDLKTNAINIIRFYNLKPSHSIIYIINTIANDLMNSKSYVNMYSIELLERQLFKEIVKILKNNDCN